MWSVDQKNNGFTTVTSGLIKFLSNAFHLVGNFFFCTNANFSDTIKRLMTVIGQYSVRIRIYNYTILDVLVVFITSSINKYMIKTPHYMIFLRFFLFYLFIVTDMCIIRKWLNRKLVQAWRRVRMKIWKNC